MTTSPSSGLSPEAKEFVPIGQTPTTSIPLYVDENTVASIYPSDHQPLMVQAIYPMMITNSKVTDLSFPEIEFHIQPSQQQQFHIDSCANISQTGSSTNNSNSSNTNTSQIMLLPTTNSAGTPTGYYPGAQILYPTNESLTGFYQMDYCEPLINFSLQHPPHISRSNRIPSQQRPNSFRQQHGIYRASSRGNNRGTRNPYYEYNNSRRNGSSYNRGNSFTSKRISSSHHSHEYNNNNNYYHHSSSSRSRGNYSSPSSTHQYDEYRKNHSDYYNQENDYHQSSQINDDETPFEFRPEDFPSLPINNPSSDKNPSQSTLSTNTKATSSWNEIVSAPRPHSTSPHAVAPSQDPRSDRSRSFNTKITERKSSNHKKSIVPPAKSPSRASKIDHESSPSIPHDQSIHTDDGFIQTKHQHRRLKRKNKLKEDPISYPQSTLDELDASPNLKQSPDDFNSNTDHIQLDDLLDALNNEQSKTHQSMKNPRISKKRFEENQNNSSKVTVEISRETKDSQNGIQPDHVHSMEKQTLNSHPLSSNSDNSSDTSDYDDAVDNFDDQ